MPEAEASLRISIDHRVNTSWKVLAPNRLVSIGILPIVNSVNEIGMWVRRRVLIPALEGWRTTKQEAEKGWWQKCSCYCEKCTTLEFCITGHWTARFWNDFQEGHKSVGTNSTSTIHEAALRQANIREHKGPSPGKTQVKFFSSAKSLPAIANRSEGFPSVFFFRFFFFFTPSPGPPPGPFPKTWLFLTFFDFKAKFWVRERKEKREREKRREEKRERREEKRREEKRREEKRREEKRREEKRREEKRREEKRREEKRREEKRREEKRREEKRREEKRREEKRREEKRREEKRREEKRRRRKNRKKKRKKKRKRKEKREKKRKEKTETGPRPQSHAEELFVIRVRGNPSLRGSLRTDLQVRLQDKSDVPAEMRVMELAWITGKRFW